MAYEFVIEDIGSVRTTVATTLTVDKDRNARFYLDGKLVSFIRCNYWTRIYVSRES